MYWEHYGTDGCCTDGCYHEAPGQMFTDFSRFGSDHFELVAVLMRSGRSARDAVAEVNLKLNRERA